VISVTVVAKFHSFGETCPVSRLPTVTPGSYM